MTQPHLDLDPPRNSGKTATKKRSSVRRDALGWSDVLRAIQSTEARTAAINHYRARGFTPDDFASQRQARLAASAALTHAEDTVELLRSSSTREAELCRIRSVRRRLEDELERVPTSALYPREVGR